MKIGILAIILILVLTFPATYLPVFAENMAKLESGVFICSLLPDGSAQIDAINAPLSGVLTVPDNLDGHPVTSIGDEAFSTYQGYGYELSEIIIPEGVSLKLQTDNESPSRA